MHDRDALKMEYEQAIVLWQHTANERNACVAFFTAVQGVIFANVREKLFNLDSSSVLLVVIGLIFANLGYQYVRRVTAYLLGYFNRAREIENQLNISVLQRGLKEAKARWTMKNRLVYAIFHCSIILGWVIVLAVNIWKHF